MSRSTRIRTIGELAADLPPPQPPLAPEAAEVAVQGITDDSRAVRPGWLFIARPGRSTDGRRDIEEARAAGAAAVLTTPDVSAPTADAGTLCFHAPVEDLPRLTARLAERFHGEPSRRLRLVGITGTNGKTTVAHLIHDLVVAARGRCGLIGTVAIDHGDGRGVEPARLTTPSACEASERLARMVEAGCEYAVMEASSHALDQERVAGLAFDIGVFTNLSGDHLDYHGTMEAYAAAKARLFALLPPAEAGGAAIVAVDAAEARRMATAGPARVVGTRVLGPAEPLDLARPPGFDSLRLARIGDFGAEGTIFERFDETGQPEGDAWRTRLLGRHNVSNLLQALLVGEELGIEPPALRDFAAEAAPPPGRLEPVPGSGGDRPLVLVDYAHTDDALGRVLEAARGVVPDGGRLAVVIGCGGDRDRTKRPRMGAAAVRGADRVYLTSDNPRSEDPRGILEAMRAGSDEAVRAGIATGEVVAVEPDRARAIEAALGDAEPGDVVVIAGKGHETEQIIGTERIPFDDRVVAADVLRRRGRGVGGAR